MRKIFLVALVAILVAGSLFSLWKILRQPEALTTGLVARVEQEAGARLSFQHSKIIFRPFPSLRLEKAELESLSHSFPSLTADTVQFSFRLLPLLWGQIQFSGFEVRSGQMEVQGLRMEEIGIRVRSLNTGGPASFEWKGKLGGDEGILRGKGRVKLRALGPDFWKDLELKVEISGKGFPLKSSLAKTFLKGVSMTWASGTLEGVLRLEKERTQGAAKGSGRFGIKNFHSGSAKEISPTGEIEFVWDGEKHSVAAERILFQTPFGELEGTGVFKLETGEIEEARLNGRQIILEEWVRAFPPLSAILPAGVSFSGESELDLTLRGTWDYLAIHANWNLTPSVLNYKTFFVKPKDFPLGINSDFLLKEGSSLSGDFSARIGRTTIKGASAKWDLRKGAGEATLLTNKFDLKEWKGLLPALNPFEISGMAKILLSWKRNPALPKENSKMFNLTLENFELLSPHGHGINEGKLLLDMSPLSLRFKDVVLKIGESSIETHGEIYNPTGDRHGPIEVRSSHLDLFSALESLRELEPLVPAQWRPRLWPEARRSIVPFLPRPFLLDGLHLKLAIQKSRLTLENLEFSTMEGEVHLRGEADQVSGKSSVWFEPRITQLQLARFGGTRTGDSHFLEGNFSFMGRFEGQGENFKKALEGLTGQGSLSVANGEWPALDFTTRLKELEPFRNFSFSDFQSTPFNDLKAAWAYKEKKFELHDLVLNSRDIWVEGEGNVSLEGILNTRLDLYLSKDLTAKLLDSWAVQENFQGKQLGPIPFLVVGNLKTPEPRVNEELVSSFLDAVRSRKFRKILHQPFLKE